MSSNSMDHDEPDSSSSDAVYADHDGGTAKDYPRQQAHQHGRLGSSAESFGLPPSAGGLLETTSTSADNHASSSAATSLLAGDEKKQSSPPPPDTESNSKSQSIGSQSQSQSSQAISPATAKADPDFDDDEDDYDDEDDDDEDDDDDGLDHAQPPDDSSETDTQATPWKPQTTQSTCEFTHTIVNYSQKRESGCKKAEYSATTVDEFGNRWRLIVYVNGNGRASNHHLSLFLQVADADDLPFGWKKAVSYVLTLEHPSGSNLSYAKRNPDKTFKLCPKAIDWGWSQFITSDRIQQEGFVSDDSLTVRASVTVKSSSVSIDSEDAELYLKCAVEEGGAEAVKLCLAQGASVNCKFKDDLYTPLHTACSSGTNGGSMEVLNLLLEKGADGNACNKWRETPLLIAANNGHRAAVEALLKHGADPSLCSEAGWSALTFAAHKGYDDIVALLLRAGAPVNCRVTEDSSTPLHKACAGSKPGHLSAVKQLLDGGADVHALNKWRETPLLTAANHGQAGAVDALLKAGADPCKCTDTGWSPLSIAAYKGHDSVVRLLLEEGAPTEEADPTLSALLQAATKGLPDTVELLLRHGADHTVTTKKGDTALSILVEQNLIDAAVEMVSEYKASVPRCSRDRKKVQRARLLINLRMKQHQREGKHLTVATDEDETDEEDLDDFRSAQHDNAGSPTSTATPHGKKKKKGSGSKVSAEDQAKAAEEALLLELEQEDAQAKKSQADAKSKQAKKKAKKERERLVKVKDEEDRLVKEVKESKERERILKEKEEKDRKERQQKLREQREKDLKVAAEREKVNAGKRKEKEEKEKKQRDLDQKQREKKGATAASPSTAAANKGKAKVTPNKKVNSPLPNGSSTGQTKSSASVATATGKSVGQVKTRGWEVKSKPITKKPEAPKLAEMPAKQQQPVVKENAGNKVVARAPVKENPTPILPPPPTNATPSAYLAPRTSEFPSNQQGGGNLAPFDAPSAGNHSFPNSPAPSPRQQQQAPPEAARNVFATNDRALRMNFNVGSVEHPAVELFRREKVTELMQRCRHALSVVDEQALKRVLYRWIVRAAHTQSSYMDCMIPSWVDYDQLATFFQRQFIAESRKGGRSSSDGTGMVNMETLREAGSSMANLCHSQAKEIVQFRLRMEEQLPRDWTDQTLMMNASDARNGNEIGVVVDWASRSKVYLSGKEFTTLRTRYVGPPNRFLTSLFAVKSRYETKAMLLGDSTLDFYLPPATKMCLSAEASVSAEFWSDPLTALESNVFWGNFEDVDKLFGGLVPFGKDDGGSEELLSRHGGSVCVLLPFDNMVASRYMRRMLDLLEECDPKGVPVSFMVFLHADCFNDIISAPSMSDLQLFDPRLGDNSKQYLRQIEQLPPGQHFFYSSGVSKVSTKGSLQILLQNEAGRSSFIVSEGSMAKIRQSMSTNVPAPSNMSMVSPMGGYNGEYQPKQSPAPPTPSSGYFEGLPPISPSPQQQPAFMDFGHSNGALVGGNDLSEAFSPPEARRTAPPRRGRLFELVDDGEPEHLNDVDVVSGMLNNLNVDLFQNNVSQDVDIEAISLMGIGGPSSRQQMPPGNSHPTHSRYG